MKTNFISFKSNSLYILLGLIGSMVTSCGSYQNSSYYDRDGIYGSSERKVVASNNRNYENSPQNNHYKYYFG